jgi:hypothetical protein
VQWFLRWLCIGMNKHDCISPFMTLLCSMLLMMLLCRIRCVYCCCLGHTRIYIFPCSEICDLIHRWSEDFLQSYSIYFTFWNTNWMVANLMFYVCLMCVHQVWWTAYFQFMIFTMTWYPEEFIQVMLRSLLKSARALAMVLDGVLYGPLCNFNSFFFSLDIVLR